MVRQQARFAVPTTCFPHCPPLQRSPSSIIVSITLLRPAVSNLLLIAGFDHKLCIGFASGPLVPTSSIPISTSRKKTLCWAHQLSAREVHCASWMERVVALAWSVKKGGKEYKGG